MEGGREAGREGEGEGQWQGQGEGEGEGEGERERWTERRKVREKSSADEALLISTARLNCDHPSWEPDLSSRGADSTGLFRQAVVCFLPISGL